MRSCRRLGITATALALATAACRPDSTACTPLEMVTAPAIAAPVGPGAARRAAAGRHIWAGEVPAAPALPQLGSGGRTRHPHALRPVVEPAGRVAAE